MENKYLEILINGFEEETDNVLIEQIKKVNDSDSLITLINYITVIQETSDVVIKALWDEFNRMTEERKTK